METDRKLGDSFLVLHHSGLEWRQPAVSCMSAQRKSGHLCHTKIGCLIAVVCNSVIRKFGLPESYSDQSLPAAQNRCIELGCQFDGWWTILAADWLQLWEILEKQGTETRSIIIFCN